MIKYQKIRFCDLELWPIILKLSGVLAVVEIYVRAKFHQATFRGLWVIVITAQKSNKKFIEDAASNTIIAIWMAKCRLC